MARAATTSDVFNAIGEPRRREIVGLLAREGEGDVERLVARLGMPQPGVSKHLRVLRQVGLVAVRKVGKRRVYRLRAEKLKPVRDWVSGFERLWDEHLLDIKEVAERKAKSRD